jgi:tRNA-(ms[2]io[6]A)-hydroxylase
MMLGLKLPTDPRWVNIVEKNIKEILTDHAYCEQKAASTAISLIIGFPEKSDLVQAMTDLVKEEMSHFKMVHDKIIKRGWSLGRERKDEYVNQLMQFFPKGGSKEDHLTHKLLYAALIEARSCERFRLLSEQLPDRELANFYRKLMVSEANHYSLFLGFARKYNQREIVDKKWNDLLEFEAQLMKNLGVKETMHG